MKKYLFEIIALIILAVSVYYVFFYDAADEAKGDKLVEEKVEPDEGGDVILSLLDISSDNDEEKDDYKFSVKNTDTDNIKLEFGSSMKYDFYITDESDEEVYRDSDEKSYMQVIQEITLEPDEHKSFSLKLPELEAGTYTLTVVLAAKGFSDEELSVDFTVE